MRLRPSKWIVVYQCPDHRDIVTVCIEDDAGSGVRVLGGKCCVRQGARHLRAWRLTPDRARSLIDELSSELEEA